MFFLFDCSVAVLMCVDAKEAYVVVYVPNEYMQVSWFNRNCHKPLVVSASDKVIRELSQSNLASYLCWNRHVVKWLAAMLVTKRSAGGTPQVNFRECMSCMLLPSANKAVYFGFETQMSCHQKSKTGLSVTPIKGLISSKNFKKRKLPQVFSSKWI